MVNTFLVCANFYRSARSLDYVRLPNQRRECIEILNNLITLRALSNLFNLLISEDPYRHHQWVRTVVSTYKNGPYNLYITWANSPSDSMSLEYQPQMFVWPKDGTSQVCHYKCTNGRIFPVKPPQPNQKPIKIGYIYHPVVIMWLGYEECLKEYTDVHIEVSIERGLKNNIPRYPSRNHPRPP